VEEQTAPATARAGLWQSQEAAKAAVLEDAAAQEDAKTKANQLLADAEVAAAEKLLRAAQIEYEIAEGERSRLGAAAFSDADRAESGKAAAVAVVGGLAAAAPLALAAGGAGELLSLADAAACCALFGVTYRCAGCVCMCVCSVCVCVLFMPAWVGACDGMGEACFWAKAAAACRPVALS
jgi:hypothetical protein